MRFDEFFRRALGKSAGPYPYQELLARGDSLPTLLDIPTGLGKTAAVILAWLWRRWFAGDLVRQATPRRLIYCLPMRTLVEQTEAAVNRWIGNLTAHDEGFQSNPVDVHVLMGGAEETAWDTHPEQDAVMIGTQDMLLSRALNRGYGMSRYRWPIHFALLNNDCLWVMDETQLMGVGLTTSAQLQGLRNTLEAYGVSQSLWMSATMDDGALSTVDFPRPDEGWRKLALTEEDLASKTVQNLVDAAKPCHRADVVLTPDSYEGNYAKNLAKQIVQSHRPGTLTLVVVNRVNRAQQVFKAVKGRLNGDDAKTDVFVIHSRFRKCDRDKYQKEALDEKTISPDGPGRIVIATQAIEAGVDISATTLFTELAPWSSLVQRFGRCNRRGTCGRDGQPEARVFWVDIDTSDAKKAKLLAIPYSTDELDTARAHIVSLSDVGPKSLEVVRYEQPRPIVHTIRRKDLLELWDTTADLAGNDLDVSRYIRDGDDTDVQVYWREWDVKENHSLPPDPRDNDGQLVFPAPSRDELCAVSIGAAKSFLGELRKWKSKKKVSVGEARRWNPLDRTWEQVNQHDVRPGNVLLLHVDAGGYDAELGWTGDVKDKVAAELPEREEDRREPESYPGKEPLLLVEHLKDVVQAADMLKISFNDTLKGIPWEAIITAARWHDVGKAHPAFQAAMRDFDTVAALDPKESQLWGKSGGSGRLKYRVGETNDEGESSPSKRPGFRHELASALVWLEQSNGETHSDLIAFLIAAHHGKVRGSIRSMPNEAQPDDPDIKFARGLRDGDEIPPVDLGNGLATNKLEVDLSLMELGEDENGRPSWLARVLKLRDQYGPFRLAYLETLLRIADWHGSDKGETSDA